MGSARVWNAAAMNVIFIWCVSRIGSRIVNNAPCHLARGWLRMYAGAVIDHPSATGVNQRRRAINDRPYNINGSSFCTIAKNTTQWVVFLRLSKNCHCEERSDVAISRYDVCSCAAVRWMVPGDSHGPNGPRNDIGLFWRPRTDSFLLKCRSVKPSRATLIRVAFDFSSPFSLIAKKKPPGWVVSFMATPNGLEPSTSSVTGWRANRLHHRAICHRVFPTTGVLYRITEHLSRGFQNFLEKICVKKQGAVWLAAW